MNFASYKISTRIDILERLDSENEQINNNSI